MHESRADILLDPSSAVFPDTRLHAPAPSIPGPQASVRLERVRKGPFIQAWVPQRYEWNRLHVTIPDLPPALEGLRIVHLTDTHFRSYWSKLYDELLEEIAKADPDLVLFTGDFVDNKHDHRPAIAVAQRFFGQLRSHLGTFAILGNHDGDLLAPRAGNWNLTLLGQRRLCLESHGGSVELIGLPGVHREDLDVEFLRSIPSRRAGGVRICLSHFPDLVRRTDFLAPDLFLAGHTHGGQICLPGRLPIIRHDTLPRHQCTGVHQIGQTWLVVNRGLGFSGLPFRAFCPAEVIEIRLARQE